LLEAFRELDYSVVVPLFYKILEYPVFFDYVAQHTMIGTEFTFVRLVYDSSLSLSVSGPL
jgi:hypothetical protein